MRDVTQFGWPHDIDATLDYRRFGPHVGSWERIHRWYIFLWEKHHHNHAKPMKPTLPRQASCAGPDFDGAARFTPIIGDKNSECLRDANRGVLTCLILCDRSPVGQRGKVARAWCGCHAMKFTSNVDMDSSYNVVILMLYLVMFFSKHTQTSASKCSRNCILHPVKSMLWWNTVTGTPEKLLFSEL